MPLIRGAYPTAPARPVFRPEQATPVARKDQRKYGANLPPRAHKLERPKTRGFLGFTYTYEFQVTWTGAGYTGLAPVTYQRTCNH